MPNTVFAAGTGGAGVIVAGESRSRTIAVDSRSAVVVVASDGTPDAGTVYVGVSRFDKNVGIELSPGIRMGAHNYALLIYGADGVQRGSVAMGAEPSKMLVAPAGSANAGRFTCWTGSTTRCR